MAITIMGGLFVATFLTLLFLPGLYALWFRKSLGERGVAESVGLAPELSGDDGLLAPQHSPLPQPAE
jgi:hypothetical protein